MIRPKDNECESRPPAIKSKLNAAFGFVCTVVVRITRVIFDENKISEGKNASKCLTDSNTESFVPLGRIALTE
jgi:hypothetical protein